MADRKGSKPRCRECIQLRKDLKSAKRQNKDLRREIDELRAIVDAGSDYLTKMVKYIEG